jgi:membrane-bound metal-dependent hydrolase YbcI (DUF457 family)
MASYRGHLAFSTTLGAVYGGLAAWQWHLGWGPACLGAGVTALGGMLPDLDSKSSVPVREVPALAAAAAPLLLLRRFRAEGYSPDQILVLLAGVYLFLRYGVATALKLLTVHRGMFHSLPALVIAGLVVFLLYHNPNLALRLYLGVGVMIGFLSHLVLDALCGMSIVGARMRANKAAGGPLKLFSPSRLATITTYCLLAGLLYLAGEVVDVSHTTWQGLVDRIWDDFARLSAAS